MATKRAAKPKPVPVTTVCDLCGLAWALHGKEPTTDDCIRLLKVEVAKRPTWQPNVYPFVYPFKEETRRYPQPIWETTAEGSPKVVINKTITT